MDFDDKAPGSGPCESLENLQNPKEAQKTIKAAGDMPPATTARKNKKAASAESGDGRTN